MSKLSWTPQAQFLGLYDYKPSGRRLGLVIAQEMEKVSLLALETSTGVRTPEDVLDDHAHKIVDRFDDFPSAFRAAEKYCTEWIKAQRENVKLQKCKCGDIP